MASCLAPLFHNLQTFHITTVGAEIQRPHTLRNPVYMLTMTNLSFEFERTWLSKRERIISFEEPLAMKPLVNTEAC